MMTRLGLGRALLLLARSAAKVQRMTLMAVLGLFATQHADAASTLDTMTFMGNGSVAEMDLTHGFTTTE